MGGLICDMMGSRATRGGMAVRPVWVTMMIIQETRWDLARLIYTRLYLLLTFRNVESHGATRV